MKKSVLIQLFISVVIGLLSNSLYVFIHDGTLGSIGLTITMISLFLFGRFFGELINRIDGVVLPKVDNFKEFK